MSPDLAPTLQAPLEPGLDRVWSASLALAADALGRFVGAPLELLEEDPAGRALVELLEAERAHAAAAPTGSVAVAGSDGAELAAALSAQLGARLGDAFGSSLLQRGELFLPGALSAYALVAEATRFQTPFARRSDGVRFAGAAVHSFGVWDSEEPVEVLEARAAQVRVHEHRQTDVGDEFVVELLGEAAGVELLLGVFPRPPTLAAAVRELLDRLRRAEGEDARLGADERLELPCVEFDLERRWTELRGLHLRGVEPSLGEVAARVRLTLDEGGASLVAEAAIATLGLAPRTFVFNRPFLLLLRRSGQAPHLACWIETSALLVPA